jgi:DNA repair protein RecO (recombination protein O)
MKSKTEAIIISSMNLGEADKLVTFFSLDRGKLRGVAKNARKSFKRFGAGLEPFTHCRLHLHEREHQELVRIESSDILTQHFTLAGDLRRMAAGSVMLELVREVAPEAERNPKAFLLLAHVLDLLNDGGDPSFLLRIFEIRFLSLLGFQPRLDRCISCGRDSERWMIFYGPRGGVLCPDCLVSSGDEPQVRLSSGAVGFYYQALRMDLDKVTRLRPPADILRELDQAFSSHTLHVLGKRLKSVEFLKSVCPI